MQTQDSGGGGGTGGSGICTISTSDLIGLQNNILTRLLKVEQFLTLLTGMDVTAGSLSEITDELGTVTNATLINALRGWITEGTFSGVAISTLGWTMYNPCTGQDEAFPIVVADTDGVLQFGAAENGTLCGESVQAWDAAGTPDFAIYSTTPGMSPSDPYQTSRGIDIYSVTNGAAGDSAIFIVSQAGLYQVQGACNFDSNIVNDGGVDVTAGIDTFSDISAISPRGSVLNSAVGQMASGIVDPDGDTSTAGTGFPGITVAGLFNLPANARIDVVLSVGYHQGGVANSSGAKQTHISVLRVGEGIDE